MTTQSPDQSLSQSPAFCRECWMPWNEKEQRWDQSSEPVLYDDDEQLQRPLVEGWAWKRCSIIAADQSPAPSKEMEDVLLFYANEWDAGHDWCDPSNALMDDRGKRARVLLRKMNHKFPSEVASEREPEAPEARAFNTSEGLINIKEKLERHFAARFDCKCSPEKHCVCIENFEASLIALAAELGKEREADKEKYIQAALARDKQATEDRDALESIIESLKTQCALRSAGHDDLRTRLNQANQQLSQLKRELSEAREESAYLRKSTEGHEKTIGDCHDELRKLRAQLLALSSAYQRQKEALENILKMTAGHYGIELEANKALAETPDVSLLGRVVDSLEDFLMITEDKYLTQAQHDKVSKAETLLSTLQPDHQK